MVKAHLVYKTLMNV